MSTRARGALLESRSGPALSRRSWALGESGVRGGRGQDPWGALHWGEGSVRVRWAWEEAENEDVDFLASPSPICDILDVSGPKR